MQVATRMISRGAVASRVAARDMKDGCALLGLFLSSFPAKYAGAYATKAAQVCRDRPAALCLQGAIRTAT